MGLICKAVGLIKANVLSAITNPQILHENIRAQPGLSQPSPFCFLAAGLSLQATIAIFLQQSTFFTCAGLTIPPKDDMKTTQIIKIADKNRMFKYKHVCLKFQISGPT